MLLLDLDVQPTLSSYFTLAERAPSRHLRDAGLQRAARRATGVAHRHRRADLILSNDDRGELNTLLLHAPDGRLRLRHLLPTLAPQYDLLLIDTQGARSVLLEMAVLASGPGTVAGDAGNPRGTRAAPMAPCSSSRTSRPTGTSASSRRRCTCSSTVCIRCRRTPG